MLWHADGKGSLLIFSCESDPPAGMKKNCKVFLKDNNLSMKISILGMDGLEFEQGDDDDAGDASDGPEKAK